MNTLTLRLTLVLTAFAFLIFVIVNVIGKALGIYNFNFFLISALIIVFIQLLIGPKLIEWQMRVKYVTPQSHPDLYYMVEELAQKAGLPMPKVGISQINVPNAFAYGSTYKNSAVCVTEPLLRILSREELKAVLGHELSHIKNRDVLFITLLSVIPMLLYRLAFHLLFWGPYYRRRSENNSGGIVLVGLLSLIFYFVSSLFLMYASRIREYFADKGSIDMGNQPSSLASALYKLVYYNARQDKGVIQEAQGIKAFFLNDITNARREITTLKDLDIDKSGTIEKEELEQMKYSNPHLSFGEKLMELMSTHPNMLKRIKQLSTYQ